MLDALRHHDDPGIHSGSEPDHPIALVIFHGVRGLFAAVLLSWVAIAALAVIAIRAFE